jgi:transposase InsO family protein
MPRMGGSAVAIRFELVKLAEQDGLSIRELCRRFRVSAPTAYKWMERFASEGMAGLKDRSHRPHHQPRRSSAELEQRVLELRRKYPVWGPRKLRRLLSDAVPAPLPSVSTVSAILRRHNLLATAAPTLADSAAPRRFEYAAPNELWQMDFKGHFALRHGRCHPLTVLDDHSRFAVGLSACANEREVTARQRLSAVFRTYGLPLRILADNGPPFGTAGTEAYSSLEVWLMRLGVAVFHGRPRHPQTQGKDERFHRTLRLELLHDREFRDLAEAQREFDGWREVYNFVRPHQALALEPPASRYRSSPRTFPEQLPPLEYASDLPVRKVQADAEIRFHNRRFKVGKAFIGFPVAIRPTLADGVFHLLFAHSVIRTIDLRSPLRHV